MRVDDQGRFGGRTLEFWQARTGRTLSLEDCRQIIENATGFFRTLQEWALREDSKEQTSRSSTSRQEARKS